MNTHNAIERLADPIGFDIGTSASNVQANFFNGFARAFERLCQDRIDKEIQASYIAEELTEQAKRVIVLLAQFSEME